MLHERQSRCEPYPHCNLPVFVRENDFTQPLNNLSGFFFFIVLHAQTAILSANLSIQARKDNLNLHLQINMQINSHK